MKNSNGNPAKPSHSARSVEVVGKSKGAELRTLETVTRNRHMNFKAEVIPSLRHKICIQGDSNKCVHCLNADNFAHCRGTEELKAHT